MFLEPYLSQVTNRFAFDMYQNVFKYRYDCKFYVRYVNDNEKKEKKLPNWFANQDRA